MALSEKCVVKLQKLYTGEIRNRTVLKVKINSMVINVVVRVFI